MENRHQTIVNDITTAVSQLLQKMDERTDAVNITRRSPLQSGIYTYVRFFYYKGAVHCFVDKGDSRPDLKYEGTDFPDAPLTAEDVAQLMPSLQQQLEQLYRTYDNNPLLDFKFEVFAKFRIDEKFLKLTALKTTSEVKKTALLKQIDLYLTQKIKEGQYPTKDLDTTFLAQHLLSPALYPEIDVPAIKTIFEKIRELNKSNKDSQRTHQHYITYALRCWAEEHFLPVYYNVAKNGWAGPVYTLVDAGQRPAPSKSQLDLLVYAGISIVRYEPNYSRPTGVGFIEKAKELGSKQAGNILKTGSDTFSKEDMQYSDADLTCTANDVFATFSITFKNETEEAYSKAITFICNLLEKDFPPSYEIKCKSKTKEVLPIKGLGKSSTQRFFANALQYPGLYPLLEKYVRLAIRHEFEWYNDVEAEQCCCPGTYAVFGLALASDSYFPLLREYLKQVDDEHQSVQNHFLVKFVQQYGVNPVTIPTLIDLLYCASDNIKPIKELKAFETAENMALLLENTASMEGYEVERVCWFIWGAKDKLAALAKKKGPLTEYYTQLLTVINS
ncbi:DUF6138 family protein [Chitinophaga sp. HK235]|uniref:DUF6138 family protein n=1 Tax=Chitinophaga sp. HK235 TaxID=2952571 RepID=UPI001BA8FBED|nr:DUF6138 family protein [Chitinophaga sp. HK235]